MNKRRLKREEISDLYKWDLSSLYKSREECFKDIKRIGPLLGELNLYKGKVMSSSFNLVNTLIINEQIERLSTNLYVYSNMKYHEDTTNDQSLILKEEIDKLLIQIKEKTIFIVLEILKSQEEVVNKYIKEEEKLKEYSFWFKRMFRKKKHLLSDQEEEMIAKMGELLEAPSNTHSIILNTDFKFGSINIKGEEVEITNSNFPVLLQNEDQAVREEVFKKYYSKYEDFKNTLGSTLKYNIKTTMFISKIRKYQSPLQMNLDSEDIPIELYNNLIKVVKSNLKPFHHFLAMKKENLGVEDFHMYDIYASKLEKSKKRFTYEEAKIMIKEALKPLGNEYLKIIEQAFQEKWIDVYDNIGKKSGAYSWGTYDSNPYILLNYQGTLNDVSTVIHELGHSLHRYLSNQNQPYIYANFSIFTAEIASTVNEILLSKYLYATMDDVQEKKVILYELLEKFRTTLYRQTMFAEFEQILFTKEEKNEILTESLISEIYYDLNKKYYGEEVLHDEEIKLEWARIPHFYRPFYVYQYATGLCAAFIITESILKEEKGMPTKYLEFLSSGNSDYSLKLLEKMGIKMKDEKVFSKTIKIFENLLLEYINLK
jgi:oligoendopeptidase F